MIQAQRQNTFRCPASQMATPSNNLVDSPALTVILSYLSTRDLVFLSRVSSRTSVAGFWSLVAAAGPPAAYLVPSIDFGGAWTDNEQCKSRPT